MSLKKGIISLIGRGVSRMAAFAGILFSLVTDIGFITRSRAVTVLMAIGIAAGGLSVDYLYGASPFYWYMAVIFVASMATKGWIASRAARKEAVE